MNSAAVKLFLALLWLLPGFGLLVHDLWTGETIAMPLGHWQVPLAVPFLIMAALNFFCWWLMRSRPPATFLHHRRRLRRPGSESEPDPAFRFDEPPERGA